MVLLLSESDIKTHISLLECIEINEKGFVELSKGSVVAPIRSRIGIEERNGVFLSMPSYVPNLDIVTTKIVAIYKDNPKKYNLPTIHSVVVVQDVKTGEILSIMDGSSITALRTAVACAIATKYLSRKDSKIVGVYGTGVVARANLLAVSKIRNIEMAKVYSRSNAHRKMFVSNISKNINAEVLACDNNKEPLRDADVVITATTSKKPVFDGRFLEDGTHINAFGNYEPDSRELDTETIIRSKIIVDSTDACLSEAGDLIIPLKQGNISRHHIYGELGEIISGKKEGRENSDEITLFKSVGIAFQDSVTTKIIYERSKEMGIGTNVEI